MVVPRDPRETERLEVTGRLSSSSRFPQYLHNAMLAGAKARDTSFLDEQVRFRIVLTMSLFFIQLGYYSAERKSSVALVRRLKKERLVRSFERLTVLTRAGITKPFPVARDEDSEFRRSGVVFRQPWTVQPGIWAHDFVILGKLRTYYYHPQKFFTSSDLFNTETSIPCSRIYIYISLVG